VNGPPRAGFAEAVGWSYVLALSRVGVTTLVTFVLAAMLGPEAIGLMAMALVFILFVEMLLQQGLLPAIVQRSELRQEHADTAFWLVLGVGSLLTVMAAALAPVWERINGTSGLAVLVWALTPIVLIQSLVVVQEAILRREMRFKSLAMRTVAVGLVGGAVGVGCALAGLGVWSLVAQQVTGALVGVVVLWRVSAWRPRRHFDKVAAGELFTFSRNSAAASIGVFLGNKADILVGGIFFGPFVIGIYRLAQRAASTGVEISSRAMQAVSLPELSARQHNMTDFAKRYLRLQQLTAAVSLPVLGAMAGVAGLLGPALGDDWTLVGLPLRGLALASALTTVAAVAGPALQAMGSPGVLAIISWARAVVVVLGLVTVGVLLEGADDQALLIAFVAVMIASAAASFVVMAVVLMSKLRLSARAYAGSLMPGVAGGVVGTAAGWGLASVLGEVMTPLLALLVSAALAVALGGLASLATVRPAVPLRRRKKGVVPAGRAAPQEAPERSPVRP
jgi:O-antigen/teichoic acid export membrane protein